MSRDGNGNGAAGVKKEDEAPSKRDSKKVRESSDVDSQIERKHINSRRKKSREKSDSDGDKSHERKRKSRRRCEDSDSGSEEDESEGSGSEYSGSDSESEGERKKREKEEEKKWRRREKKKKRRKKEKEEERRKKKKETGQKGAVTNLWGKYGVIRETDMWTKRPEFTSWLSEVKQIHGGSQHSYLPFQIVGDGLPVQAQAMKEQAQLREEMAYQYKLGNFEAAAAAIQRRLDPDAAI